MPDVPGIWGLDEFTVLGVGTQHTNVPIVWNLRGVNTTSYFNTGSVGFDKVSYDAADDVELRIVTAH